MQNYYGFIIPRLDGSDIKKNFSKYLSLVRKGVAGFIVFGGKLEQVRSCIQALQDEAELPLIIASDLERGLGQQLEGGTNLPPAMALANATRKRRKAGGEMFGRNGDPPVNLPLLRKTFSALAREARYAGINTILAPVLDINTNPRNPIICTRSFGEDSGTVSFFGDQMINTLQGRGIAACGKHFPGHGDTAVDSHVKLPVINRGLPELKRNELRPFNRAVECGVKMIMLGHLCVPALDPSGVPVSISEKAVGYIRRNMKYKGILITDAMNMGGLGRYSEQEACFAALHAGVDILLHPSDPGKIVSWLKKKNVSFAADRLEDFRRQLDRTPPASLPDFGKNRQLSELLTRRAIRSAGSVDVKGRPFLIILNDEDDEKGSFFSRRFRLHLPRTESKILTRQGEARDITIPGGAGVIVAVFSETRAWKGGASDWLYRQINYLEDRADLFVSFGSPYLFDRIRDTAKIFAYWDSASAQNAAADLIAKRYLSSG